MRKFKKTKRIKQKGLKKNKKTRKFIRIGGEICAFVRNMLPKLKPIKVNTINGDAIYRVNIKGRNYYFFGQHKKYVIIGNTKQIFKLDERADDLPKETIDKIKAINFVELAKTGEYYFKRKIEELAHKDDILYFRHEESPIINFDLDAAKRKLIELNKTLRMKCSNLSLYIDYVYNHREDSTLELPGDLDSPHLLVLCLYKDNHCISSITITLQKATELSIESNTHHEQKNKKYNILLRCTLIIISKLLSKDIQRITSIAINPISAYILITYFGGTLKNNNSKTKFLDFSIENNMPFDDNNTGLKLKELLNLYYQKGKFGGLFIFVELSDKNIENAKQKFNEILERIQC